MQCWTRLSIMSNIVTDHLDAGALEAQGSNDVTPGNNVSLDFFQTICCFKSIFHRFDEAWPPTRIAKWSQ